MGGASEHGSLQILDADVAKLQARAACRARELLHRLPRRLALEHLRRRSKVVQGVAKRELDPVLFLPCVSHQNEEIDKAGI